MALVTMIDYLYQGLNRGRCIYFQDLYTAFPLLKVKRVLLSELALLDLSGAFNSALPVVIWIGM